MADQENAEPSTRPKHPDTVEVGVETEEPSTRPKVHEYAERETQTDSIKRKQSVAREGPSSKRKRLEAEYPDSACGYTSSTNEDEEEPEENEWEVATPSATPQKNELRRIKLRRRGAPRPMHAALRINVPDGARSGFQRAGGFADEGNLIDRIESRAVTLRNLGLAPTNPTQMAGNIPQGSSQTETEAPVTPASPIRSPYDASSSEVYHTPPRYVDHPQAPAATALPNVPSRRRFHEFIVLPGGHGDAPLFRRTPSVPIQIPNIRLNLEEFERFAADRHVSLVGIDYNQILVEILRRTNVLRGGLYGREHVWPPLHHPVFRKPSRELIALMTFALHLFGNTEIALLLIYCISKYQIATLRKFMSDIFDNRFRL